MHGLMNIKTVVVIFSNYYKIKFFYILKLISFLKFFVCFKVD